MRKWSGGRDHFRTRTGIIRRGCGGGRIREIRYEHAPAKGEQTPQPTGTAADGLFVHKTSQDLMHRPFQTNAEAAVAGATPDRSHALIDRSASSAEPKASGIRRLDRTHPQPPQS